MEELYLYLVLITNHNLEIHCFAEVRYKTTLNKFLVIFVVQECPHYMYLGLFICMMLIEMAVNDG